MEHKGEIKVLFMFAAVVIGTMVGYRFWMLKQCPAMCETPVSKHGVVNGIIHTDDRPTAVIGSEIVHEGDMIDGVKVVQICNNQVQFEKNCQKWTQLVNERPNPAWSKGN